MWSSKCPASDAKCSVLLPEDHLDYNPYFPVSLKASRLHELQRGLLGFMDPSTSSSTCSTDMVGQEHLSHCILYLAR